MNIERLIQLNIEIEGLLRVLKDRDNNDALQLLKDKYSEFKSAFEEVPAEPAVTEISELSENSECSECSENSENSECSEQPIEQPAAQPVEQPTEPADIPAPTTVDEIVASRPNEMRVDEMLTRREARDLRKAFTLNDKFRFRRELFANNDAVFADTLNLLSAMQNLDEAMEYMRDDLGWDMESDDVKDFVNIVSNHFASV
jgi:hypothetical protein